MREVGIRRGSPRSGLHSSGDGDVSRYRTGDQDVLRWMGEAQQQQSHVCGTMITKPGHRPANVKHRPAVQQASLRCPAVAPPQQQQL